MKDFFVPFEAIVKPLIKEITMNKENQASREWMQRVGGPMVRVLSVNRYDEAGNERVFVWRLPVDDGRPLGFHLSGMTDSGIKIYEDLPFGAWVEIVFEPVISWEMDKKRIAKAIRRACRKFGIPNVMCDYSNGTAFAL